MPDQRDLRVLALFEIVELGVAGIAFAAMVFCLRYRRGSEVLVGSLAVIGVAYLALAVRTAAGLVVLSRQLLLRDPTPMPSVRRHPYRSIASHKWN